jgi:hypothetical protein
VSLVRNERLKLLATLLNNCAVATFATAVLTPSIGALYGTGPLPTGWYAVGLLAFLAGVSRHGLAQFALGGLKP